MSMGYIMTGVEIAYEEKLIDLTQVITERFE